MLSPIPVTLSNYPFGWVKNNKGAACAAALLTVSGDFVISSDWDLPPA
jgi:hypothetical protein